MSAKEGSVRAHLVTGLDPSHFDAGVVVKDREGRTVARSHPVPVGETVCVASDSSLDRAAATALVASLGCRVVGPWLPIGEPHVLRGNGGGSLGFDEWEAEVRDLPGPPPSAGLQHPQADELYH